MDRRSPPSSRKCTSGMPLCRDGRSSAWASTGGSDTLRTPRSSRGAVSGTLHVRTAGTLAELCSLEYRMTNADRACQSTYEAVLCCAGAFVMYRRSALSALWSAYQDQRFLGVPCRQGEDLHLTNLLLRAGLRTRFAADAHAWTTSPDRMRGYLRQQLRWSRSHWRELRWLLPQLRNLPPYAALDVVVRAAPALQYAALPLLWLTASMTHAAVVGAALVVEECILMFFRAQGHRLWRRYAALRVLVQIPVQVWAVCTVFSQVWLTRGPTRTLPVEPHPRHGGSGGAGARRDAATLRRIRRTGQCDSAKPRPPSGAAAVAVPRRPHTAHHRQRDPGGSRGAPVAPRARPHQRHRHQPLLAAEPGRRAADPRAADGERRGPGHPRGVRR